MQKRRAHAWEETPEHIIGLLQGFEKGKESAAFRAYCDAVRSCIHERMFKSALGPRGLFERRYERAWRLGARWQSLKQLPGPEIFSDAGRLIWPDIERAERKAQAQLAKYFPKVRALLHSHVVAWLRCEKNTASLMAAHPEIERHMQALLRMRHPFAIWSRTGPSEITYPTSESFSGKGAEIEAARLFLVLLVWPDWPLISHIRECQECREVYVASRSDQQFCDTPCRKRFASHSPEFRAKRAKYMREIFRPGEKEKEARAKQQVKNWK